MPREMTPEQKEMALLLGRCRFAPATHDKRFARDMAERARMAEPKPLSEKQDAELRRLCHRYRKQIAGIKSLPTPTPKAGGNG